MKVMLVGATGLVGGQVLQQLLDDPRCDAVVAPTGGRWRMPTRPCTTRWSTSSGCRWTHPGGRWMR